MPNPVALPTPPQAIRVFAGYRREGLDAAAFYQDLGTTFMPGTPAILAPLGLGGYIAAVLDLGDGLPDEVALIVYASVEAYNNARQSSLLGRMYTHSHAGVFDMARSRGQFPRTAEAPDKLPNEDRAAWYLFDRAVDWQQGETRLLFLTAPQGMNLQQAALEQSAARREALRALGVEQLVGVATPAYAALWLTGEGVGRQPFSQLDLIPQGATLRRDLVAEPVVMRTGTEGPKITEPRAYSFRFVRDLRFFL